MSIWGTLSYAGVGRYRDIEGVDNNPDYQEWGSTGEWLSRLMPVAYSDGYSAPSGASRPNPRAVSQAVSDQDESVPNATGASNFLWAWGQFVDHDIDLTPIGSTEYMPISVPSGDPHFDPAGTGSQVIHFTRSEYDPATGTDVPREQFNKITAYIDASNVYGSDPVRAEFLRAEGGKLKVGEGDLLPRNDGSLPNDGPGADTAFVAGDVRANENVALTSMHTIFVREHNRLVDELHAQHPDWDSETLYQEAKALVEAKIQAITYNEFLPLLLGESALPEYGGYDAAVNPGISNVFATAAYRVGHTMLSATIQRLEENGGTVEEGHLALREAFFSPHRIAEEGGIDPLLRGLAASQAEEIDALVVDDVRNFLFGPPGAGGLDLVALNIQRGRDHGLPSYNEARQAMGLETAADFSDVTDQVWLQERLAAVYDNVDEIDIFIGGLAEDHVQGAMVGELIHSILVDQFTRLRDGDRYWYENRFEGETLADLRDTSLSGIIVANTGIEHLQHDVFLASNRQGGTERSDRLTGDWERDLIYGAEGNDRIRGGGGNDDLFGDTGNDRLYGDWGEDWLWGGEGNDRLHGGWGDDTLYGGNGRDRMDGGWGDDVMYGGDGRDRMDGGWGDDTLYGGAGPDRMDGGWGDDTLYGGAGPDRMDGGWGDDTLVGGDGRDRLYGGNGDDWIEGGAGNDLIFTGRGSDVVAFDSGYGAGDRAGERDRVIDADEGDRLYFGDLLNTDLDLLPQASADDVDRAGNWHYAERGGLLSVFSEAAMAVVTVDLLSREEMTAEQMSLVFM